MNSLHERRDLGKQHVLETEREAKSEPQVPELVYLVTYSIRLDLVHTTASELSTSYHRQKSG